MKPILACSVVVFMIVLPISNAEVYGIDNESIKADVSAGDKVKISQAIRFPPTEIGSLDKDGDEKIVHTMPAKVGIVPASGIQGSFGTIKDTIDRLKKPLQCLGSIPAVPKLDTPGPEASVRVNSVSKMKMPMKPVKVIQPHQEVN